MSAHWTEISDTTSGWAEIGSSAQAWADSESSLNPGSAFVALNPAQDAGGGIDFPLTFSSVNPFRFVANLSKAFNASAGEIP